MLLEGEAAPGEELAAPSVHTWIHRGSLLSRSRCGFFLSKQAEVDLVRPFTLRKKGRYFAPSL